MGTIVAASAAPYGYTISIWSSGAVLMHSHGTPSVAYVFAFLAGALTGFGLMGLLARGGLTRAEPHEHAPDRVLAGAMHWLAAGAAVGAAALVARIGGWEAVTSTSPTAPSSSSPAAGAASPSGSSRAIRPHRYSRPRPMTSSASSR